MNDFQGRILFPVDLLPLDTSIINQVTRTCKEYGTGLHLYHVLSPFSDLPMGFPVPDSFYEQISTISSHSLRKIANEFSSKGIPVSVALYRGEPDTITLALAAQGDKEMIILVSRGKGAIGRIFLGSTSTSIIHHSPLPVLLLKPAEVMDLSKKSYRDIPLPDNILTPSPSGPGSMTSPP